MNSFYYQIAFVIIAYTKNKNKLKEKVQNFNVITKGLIETDICMISQTVYRCEQNNDNCTFSMEYQVCMYNPSFIFGTSPREFILFSNISHRGPSPKSITLILYSVVKFDRQIMRKFYLNVLFYFVDDTFGNVSLKKTQYLMMH